MGDICMSDVEKIREHFQFIGHTPSEEILNKCLELCTTHQLSEEDFVDRWVAFSLSNSKDAAPTLHGLELMERKDFSQNKKQSVVTAKTPQSKKTIILQVEPTTTEPVTVTTPKRNRQQPSEILNDVIPSSPVSRVESYSKRSDPGKVVYKYGTNINFIPCFSHIDVKLFGSLHNQGMPIDAKYMCEVLAAKRKGLADIAAYVASYIAKSHSIDLPEDMFSNEDFNDEYLYGRITCDSDGKLNAASVLLELPSGDASRGDAISLNLSQVKSFSIFPGQVVIVKGNVIKKKMNVRELYTTSNRTPTSICKIPESVQIIVAAGPFSVKGDLNYEPLQDLLKYVMEKKPHVLILTGPFVDADNDFVCNGDMTESYDSFFHTLVESVMAPLADTNISVVFVASSKDVHHDLVYPTPPYKLKKKYPNLTCAPDPCLLNIHGLIIGITTMDILFHVGKQELCWPSIQGDRMARLSRYLLSQMCFYPLYPPERNNVFVDHSLLEKFGIMETMPHLLIVPSLFKHFVKKVEGCTVINPERLVKGYAGGTFARLNVSMKQEVDISCEITRI